MANRIIKTILRFIGSAGLIGGAIWLTIAHKEAFTTSQYFYGYAIWGICIIFSHYNTLKNSKSFYAAIIRYFSLAIILIPILFFLFELLKYFSPYYSLIDIIHRSPIFGYIEIALYIICLILGVAFIWKKNRPMYNPVYRASFFYIFHITLFYCAVIRAYWSYQISFATFSPYLKTSYHTVIAIACAYFLNRFYKEKQPLFKIPKGKQYALYLRSFNDDRKVKLDTNLSDFYKSQNIEIIQVADPSKASYRKSFQGKNLFLLSADWKKELAFCIKNAEQIILSLGTSEGVQWEMYSNIQYVDKYLFYVPNKSILSEHANLISQKYNDNPVAEAIMGLCQIDYPSFYFIIKGDRCYYATNFETLIARDSLDGVLYIRIKSHTKAANAQEETTKKTSQNILTKIGLKRLSVPIVALCAILSFLLCGNNSSSLSKGYIIFLVICYIWIVIISFKQINDAEK